MPKKSTPDSGTVIIVGAGVSGLAAARECLQRGFAPLILEGRNRPGGRVWTDHSLNTPVDMGAAWIHGKSGNPIYKVCRKNGIKTLVTDYSRSCLLSETGEKADFLNRLAFSARANRVMPRLRRLRKGLQQDISLAKAVDRLLQETAMSRAELCFLNRHLIEFQAYNGSTLEEQSFFHLLESDEARHGEDMLFPQGYSQVVTALADGLQIEYEETVLAIRQADKRVRVETDKGSHDADFAIVTLPLGVLQAGTVEFTPQLPDAKKKAISELKMGLFNKIAMCFEQPFWESECHLIEMMPERSDLVYQFLNMHSYTGEALLIACVAADTARELEQESDEMILKKTLDLLHRLYPGKVGSPTAVKISRWGQDKFARGAYTFVPTGMTSQPFDALAEPFGRIHFAGEASSYQGQGTVHGAYNSGIRAARELGKLPE